MVYDALLNRGQIRWSIICHQSENSTLLRLNGFLILIGVNPSHATSHSRARELREGGFATHLELMVTLLGALEDGASHVKKLRESELADVKNLDVK